MAAFDFKKDRRDLYQPAITPAIVDVPAMPFFTVGGKGDPNTSKAYAQAVELLYSLSYAIKMNKVETGYFPYAVAPLEGLWDLPNPAAPDKKQFLWRMMIRQPDFVTPQIAEAAKASLQKKKPHLDASLAQFMPYDEGICVHALHLGSYDSEPATIAALKRYQEQRGFMLDYTRGRQHHEIYLNNPKTTAPEKLKTIIRLPIKRR